MGLLLKTVLLVFQLFGKPQLLLVMFNCLLKQLNCILSFSSLRPLKRAAA